LKTLIQLGEDRTPDALEFSGLKMLVEISTATTDVEKGNKSKKSIRVWAKIDTAAYKTHLSYKITEYLSLSKKGAKQNVPTGGGLIDTKTYSIDLKFVDYNLDPFLNLDIGSLDKFPFSFEKALDYPEEQKNIGVLVGRDILSRWNMCWDGPTSTVTIIE